MYGIQEILISQGYIVHTHNSLFPPKKVSFICALSTYILVFKKKNTEKIHYFCTQSNDLLMYGTFLDLEFFHSIFIGTVLIDFCTDPCQ